MKILPLQDNTRKWPVCKKGNGFKGNGEKILRAEREVLPREDCSLLGYNQKILC